MNRTGKITDYTVGEGRLITAESMSRVAICRQDMAEEGFTNQEMATAFALEVLQCMEIALPDKKLRDIWFRAVFGIG